MQQDIKRRALNIFRNPPKLGTPKSTYVLESPVRTQYIGKPPENITLII